MTKPVQSIVVQVEPEGFSGYSREVLARVTGNALARFQEGYYVMVPVPTIAEGDELVHVLREAQELGDKMLRELRL